MAKRKAKAVVDEDADAPAASTARPKKATGGKKAAAAVEPADEVEGSGDEDAPKPKKARKAKEPVVPLDPDQPTNTSMPATLTFAPRADDSVRLSAWNITSLKSSMAKGFRTYVEADDADVLILTETKCADLPATAEHDFLRERYPHRKFGIGPKTSHGGTAILSKIEPLDVTVGLPTLPDTDTNGNILTAEFAHSYVVATYVPNSGAGLKNLDDRKEFNEALERHLRDLDAKKPVIWMGDLNVAHKEIDLRNAKTNWNKTPGYSEAECDGFEATLNPAEDSGHAKLIDVWRHRNPERVGGYSYWGWRFQARTKGIGWRLDYAVVSERLMPEVQDCVIRAEAYGASDHVPIVLDVKQSAL